MVDRKNFEPYFAVIFTSKIISIGDDSYRELAIKMLEIAQQQPGFLGFESARNEIGISISYWSDRDAIKNWKTNSEHLLAQKMGREKFYQHYKVRIALVEREYEFGSADLD